MAKQRRTILKKSPEERAQRPLPSLMERSKERDPLHRRFSAVGSSELSLGSNASDDSEDRRRERALMWHRRWAMPTYDKMRQHVMNTPGLDITLDDIDLLPWNKH